MRRRQLAVGRKVDHQSRRHVVRFHGHDSQAARARRKSSRTSARSSWPGIRPEGSSSRVTRCRITCTTRLEFPCLYVVANPSSYAWPDSTRPLPVDDAAPRTRSSGGRRNAAHEVLVRAVRRGRLPELRPVACRPGAADQRLHGGNARRSAEEAARRAADDLPAVAGRHAAARRVRFVVLRHGAGRHAPRARRGVRETGQRAVRREAQRR